jgi:FixJ family two-component response regulator
MIGVTRVGSAQDFLRSKRPDAPGCLDFQRRLVEANTPIPIIFITGHGDIPMSVTAMKAGAVEFLTKPFRDRDLLDATQLALGRDPTRRQRESEIAVLRERFESLTPREREVLPLVVSGRLNKETATELGTSETTIKMHRASVMREMQAESLVDLVKMAVAWVIRQNDRHNA